MMLNPYSIVPAVLPNDPLAFFDTHVAVAPAEEAPAKKRRHCSHFPLSTYSHRYARKTMALKRQFLAPIQEDPLPARMVRRIQYQAASGQSLFDVARDTASRPAKWLGRRRSRRLAPAQEPAPLGL